MKKFTTFPVIQRSISVFTCLFFPVVLMADSTRVFTLDDFYSQILRHHPVAKQAALLSETAKQEIRMARGLLDPQISSKFYKKELGGDNYYTLWDNTLKIPIWYGTDIKVGFERNSGINVNGENLTPSDGLSYIGITVPLGQGLVIDERRAAIQQAKLLEGLAEADKITLINKLLLQAAKEYWNWMFAYHQWQLYEHGYQLAVFRFNGVKERVLQGDLPAIDSVEAKIEMQNRQVMMNQSQVAYQNASLMVSNYLWTEHNTPLEITDGIIPLAEPENAAMQPDSLKNLINAARTNHPELIRLRVKQQQLDIERKYLADKFKPKINLEYNLIQKGFPLGNTAFDNVYSTNNYKFGFNFHFPIFLRNERGKLQINKLKQVETDLAQQQSTREILNQIQATYNELLALDEQMQLQEEMVINAELLRNGEQQLFDNGESSLFLINAREMNLISNQVKLYALKAKYAKAKATLQWAAGSMIIHHN